MVETTISDAEVNRIFQDAMLRAAENVWSNEEDNYDAPVSSLAALSRSRGRGIKQERNMGFQFLHLIYWLLLWPPPYRLGSLEYWKLSQMAGSAG
jgi:hypothetical protein